MNRLIKISAYIAVFAATVTWAQQQSEMYLSGEFNGWGTQPMSMAGSRAWNVTLTGLSGSQQFKFRDASGDNWDHNWGSGGSVMLNVSYSLAHAGGNGNYNFTSGKYYTFCWLDVADFATSSMILQETDAEPVNINSVSDDSDTAGLNGVVVTINLSGSPSGELPYVRYSTNGWNSSQFVQASLISGTTWQATIPAQTNGATVSYYILTTAVGMPTHAEADLQTIKLNNFSGANYNYVQNGGTVVPAGTLGAVTNFVWQTVNGQSRGLFYFEEGVCEVTPYAPDLFRVRWHWDGLWDKPEIAIAKTYTNWTPIAATQTFATVNGQGVVEIATDELVAEIHTNALFHVNFRDKASGYYLLKGRHFQFDKDYNPYTDSTYNQSGNMSLPEGYHLKATMEMPTNEAYFGLGSEARELNRRNRNIQMWNFDAWGWEEDWNPLYTAFPFFYGVQEDDAVEGHPAFAYGIFFQNPARPVFKMGTEANDSYSFEAADGQIDYFFFGGGTEHEMPAILNRYSELTGRPVMLPKWVMGYVQSRYSYNSQATVEWLAETFANSTTENFPCDSIIIDIDYMNQNLTINPPYTDNRLWQLQFEPNRFPNPANMIQYCEDRGIKLVPIVEPWINVNDPEHYSEANSAGHFVKDNNSNTVTSSGTYFGDMSWIDFTSTTARDWWKGKLVQFYTDFPFAGMWNDLNEPAHDGVIPRNGLYSLDGVYGDNSDSRRHHLNIKNTFCEWETSITYEALEEAFPNQRPFVLSRSGWAGIQRYAVGWSGDNTHSYDHLRHNIRLGNSVMISGQANFGHDVGGFIHRNNYNRLPELLTRFVQQSALQPMIRNHTSIGNPNREPFRFTNTEDYNWQKNIVEMRYKLLPYLYSLAAYAHESGIPLNAPPVFWFHAEDPNTYTNEYEISVGEQMLVAPVYEENATTRSVYLPAVGNWYFWPNAFYDYKHEQMVTDRRLMEKYAGGQAVTVAAPAGILPIFVKAGAIIPMGPRMQNTTEFEPNFLDIHTWPSSNQTEFTLHEDDGISIDYRSGEYAKRLLTSVQTTNTWTFQISAQTGSFDPYTAGTRDFYIIAHDLNPVASLTINGQPIVRYGNRQAMDEKASHGWNLEEPAATVLNTNATTGWAYDSLTRTLLVKLPETGSNLIQATFASGTACDNVAPTTYASSYNKMSLAGTFNLWNTSANNMQLIADNTWAVVARFSNVQNVGLKFVADNQNATTWGDSSQADTTVPLDEIAGGSSDNSITVSGTMNGVYTIVFNEQTRAYSIKLAANSDSDSDGFSDEDEYAFGMNPYADDSAKDLDCDGYDNQTETNITANLVNKNGVIPAGPDELTALKNTANSVNISWTGGSGTYSLVLVSQGASAPADAPADWTLYSADNNFNAHAGSAIGGWKVVYQGSAASTTVTNLDTAIKTHVRVYEFNGTINGTQKYSTNYVTAEVVEAGIQLDSFSLEVDETQVSVCWETGLEVDTTGFNVYRQTGPTTWTKINVSLIPAQGSTNGGVGAYCIIDSGAVPGETYTYKLEDISNSIVTEHGPFQRLAYYLYLSVEPPLSVTNFIISWPSQTDMVYEIYRALDEVTNLTQYVTGIPATPPENRYTDSVDTISRAYYRIKVQE